MTGYRVVDMASVLMGPLATQIFGDYGADVIKIEPPEGDVARHAGAMRNRAMGSLYMATGRNKRSLVLDIKKPDGKAALLKLCESADVFIHNVRPEAMRRAGLDYEALRAVNPAIVYVALVGFGAGGRYANRPAFDDIIQGAAGVCGLFQRAGQEEPPFVPWNVADRITGITAAHATLAALLMRKDTGLGQAVEVPMFETVTQMVLGDHMGGMAFVPQAGEPGYARLLTPGRRPYRTQDGHIVVTPYTDRQFAALLGAVGRAGEMRTNPILRDLQARQRHWPEIYALLSAVMATKTNTDWLEICGQGEVPCTPVRTLEDLVDDPHLDDVGLFCESDHPTEGRVREMRPSTRWSGADVSIRRHAPTIGEHSVEILREAGFAEPAIAALIASGATLDGSTARPNRASST
jgi:crotonobetainyl-CoA:carnitine CoA-transferase CaiB-like acyl-CoA transferase